MNISSVSSSTSSLAQEATETKAVTQQEAAKGDPQAVAKLAREEAAAANSQPTSNAPSGGHQLNLHA